MSDILKNAVARAKVLRDVAIENAKTMLMESLDDKVEGIISSKLKAESEDENDETPEFEDEFSEGEESDDEESKEDEFSEGEESDDEESKEDEFSEGEESDDEESKEDEFSEGEDSAEDDMNDDDDFDAEFESIIRELEGEKSDDEESKEDEFSEGEESDDEESDDEESKEDEFSEGEESDDEESEGKDSDDIKNEIKLETLRTKNMKLKSQIAERDKVINTLVEQIEDLNLFNFKLFHTTKLFKKFNLSNNSKMKIIEAFDRATTVREVKLMYATLVESYNSINQQPVKSKKIKSIKNINEVKSGASKPILTNSLFNVTTSSTEGNDFTSRLAQLANIKNNK